MEAVYAYQALLLNRERITYVFERFVRKVRRFLAEGVKIGQNVFSTVEKSIAVVAVGVAIFGPFLGYDPVLGALIAVVAVTLWFLARHLLASLWRPDIPLPVVAAPYVVRIGSSPEAILYADGLAEHYFGTDAISHDKMKLIYAKNNYSLVTLYDANGPCVGYADFFPLKPEAAHCILHREKDETELSSDDVMLFAEWVKAGPPRYLYAAGIGVKKQADDGTAGTGLRMQMGAILHGALATLRHVFAGRPVEFTIIATAGRNGEEFLSNVGMTSAGIHTDVGEIYTREVSPDDFLRMLSAYEKPRSILILQEGRWVPMAAEPAAKVVTEIKVVGEQPHVATPSLGS